MNDTQDTPALALKDVRFRWDGKAPFEIAIDSFEVQRGETVLLLGDSGSGKTTLLSLICGIILPHSGLLQVDGTALADLRAGARDRFRAERIGIIFQQFNLLPYARVLDNILLPLQFAPDRRRRAGQGAQAATRLCAALGLPYGLLHAPAERLSTGQQQRVAVARAMIGAPPLIVADEPASALDAGAQSAFLDLLFANVARANSTLLMVSHDPRLGDRFDRVVQLDGIAQTQRLAA